MPNLIIGSRGSKLALWQTNRIKSRLEEAYPGLVIAIEIIKTTGDKLTEASLAAIGGKGVFTKEIEEALLDHRVDLAVHSLKDLPTTLPDGLHIAAITEREDARDALIVRAALRDGVKSIRDLPEGARVGTSSLRRRSQLLHLRPDLRIIELRGNVETRLRKLDEGDYDAIVLAAAGLNRLGFSDRIAARLATSEMLTAVGQGALGVEARVDDQRVNLLLEVLNHAPTRYATEAERAVLRNLGGGCAVPIAAFGRIKKNGKRRKLILDALVADREGRQVIRRQISGRPERAEELGSKLAESLAAAGARELLPGIGGESFAQAVLGKPDRETQTESSPRSSTAKLPEGAPPKVMSAATSALETAKPPEGGPPNAIPVPTSPREMAINSADAQRPLAGRRIIVTRAIKQSGEMTRALEQLGAEVISCPMIEIKEPSSWAQLDWALIHLSWYDWLVFTSANGVEYFLRRLDELGHGRAELMPHRVCAVGRKTAEKLKSENIPVDLTPERFTAEAVVEEFIKRYGVRQRLRGSRMLLPASRATRDVIRPAMEKIGVYVEVVEAYQTVLPAATTEEAMKLFGAAKADYIIFTSPSTVANLAAILETDHLAQRLATTRVACIGPVTADAARLHGLGVHIQPEEHTGQAVVTAIVADSLNSREK
jgi:hydroxymethylbilane synthase